MLRHVLPRVPLRLATAGPSRRAPLILRSFSDRQEPNILDQFEDQITPREVVDRKRKEFEAKYADKLKARAAKEGVADLEALKEKLHAPSVAAKERAKEWAKEEADKAEKQRLEEEKEQAELASSRADAAEARKQAVRDAQAKGDRAGVKPLASIINLPLILMTPHEADAIAKIWNTYHTTHATLAPSFLSATLPAATYESMLSVARANPFFVLPLPRPMTRVNGTSNVNGTTGAFEMFYMQWLFHAPPAAPPMPEGSASDGAKGQQALPPVASVIFTPLEEFKQAAEWAQPYLTITFYPDLAATHSTVLMRGEIAAQSAKGPPGSAENPGYLLSQAEGQLLALALQRFYCSHLVPPQESAEDRADRESRAEALVTFRERPQDWNWDKLVTMAYGGLA